MMRMISQMVIVLSLLACLAPPARAQAIFNVTNSADAGPGTLRQALLDSNLTTQTDQIYFNLDAPRVIRLLSDLPDITEPVVIDGTTQPGYAGSALVTLDGGWLPNSSNGLTIEADETTVRGLVLLGFDNIYLKIRGSDNIIQNNIIGTTAARTIPSEIALTSSTIGILIEGTSPTLKPLRNQIGGDLETEGNFVVGVNVGIQAYHADQNLIQGNIVAMNNQVATPQWHSSGICLSHHANQNIIGGTQTGLGNIVLGHDTHAIEISLSSQNRLYGNSIGVDPRGIIQAVNSSVGIFLSEGEGNIIGGPNPGEGNVIADQKYDGISCLANYTTIQGNLIGLDWDGVTPRGNRRQGIRVRGGDFNLIGGTAAGEGNRIAHSTYHGVGITSIPAFSVFPEYVPFGNSILGNSIFSNGALGIVLKDDDFEFEPGAEDVTPNDPGDADEGANQTQNFPVIARAAQIEAGGCLIEGTLDSEANKTYRIEFFASESCDASGNGEGKRYLGATQTTTTGSGQALFSAVLTSDIAVQESITATATDPSGNTSEFSACSAALPSIPPAAATREWMQFVR
jgi:hypothetical protein